MQGIYLTFFDNTVVVVGQRGSVTVVVVDAADD
jgi:hypothetical protein